MVQYIDKNALVAEIEKRYEYWREKEFNSHSIESETRMSECQYLMLLLNTFEVKEVDLEKEIEEYVLGMPMSEFTHESEVEDSWDWARKSFRHFFELGLKAQKGE